VGAIKSRHRSLHSELQICGGTRAEIVPNRDAQPETISGKTPCFIAFR
jgi:hypothetical protein